MAQFQPRGTITRVARCANVVYVGQTDRQIDRQTDSKKKKKNPLIFSPEPSGGQPFGVAWERIDCNTLTTAVFISALSDGRQGAMKRRMWVNNCEIIIILQTIRQYTC